MLNTPIVDLAVFILLCLYLIILKLHTPGNRTSIKIVSNSLHFYNEFRLINA